MKSERSVGPAMTAEEVAELREAIRFESELVHRRTTWLLASQSLLFAGLGAMIKGGAQFKDVRFLFFGAASLGAVTCLGAFLGVLAAKLEMHRGFWLLETHAQHSAYVKERPSFNLALRRGDARWTYFFGDLASLTIPAAFLTTWSALLIKLVVFKPEDALRVWWDVPLLLLLVGVPLILAGGGAFLGWRRWPCRKIHSGGRPPGPSLLAASEPSVESANLPSTIHDIGSS